MRGGPDGCEVHAVDRTGEPVEVTIAADRLVLATGAYDRPVPFPGWELPGVMTAGAAQALLKGHGVLAGRRVVVAGTGPFLLPVAAGLAARGATVVAVHEANHPGGWLRHPGAIAGAAGKLGEAAGYAAALARHRVPVRHRSMVVAAHGDGQLERVTVARLDSAGRIRPGSRREVAADVLAVGYGFAIQSELLQQAGAALHATDRPGPGRQHRRRPVHRQPTRLRRGRVHRRRRSAACDCRRTHRRSGARPVPHRYPSSARAATGCADSPRPCTPSTPCPRHG